MNIIITAEVTYEISNVKTFEQALGLFEYMVSEVKVSDANYISTKNIFGTEVDLLGRIKPQPQTWEQETTS